MNYKKFIKLLIRGLEVYLDIENKKRRLYILHINYINTPLSISLSLDKHKKSIINIPFKYIVSIYSVKNKGINISYLKKKDDLISNIKIIVDTESSSLLLSSYLDDFTTMYKQNINNLCFSCWSNKKPVLLLNCNHQYCYDCIEKTNKNDIINPIHLENNGKFICKYCNIN